MCVCLFVCGIDYYAADCHRLVLSGVCLVTVFCDVGGLGGGMRSTECRANC